ncbi:hypothetical protein [Sphingomonas sp.]|uniref:hypothetical protein n=1 Tax=Sphingomonas sp. TaxID=28214 RepID=UPI0035C798C0
MAALDYFTGAARGWRDEAGERLDVLIARRGMGAERYIAKRLERTTWGSFERRRWTYIAALLERRERAVEAPRLERAFIDLRATGDDDDAAWPEHRAGS